VATLSVSVRVLPQPADVSTEELNGLFADEISKFETWFSKVQEQHGAPGQRLIGTEHAILRSFMFYLHGTTNGTIEVTTPPETGNGNSQA
jgi:hypothetical protein